MSKVTFQSDAQVGERPFPLLAIKLWSRDHGIRQLAPLRPDAAGQSSEFRRRAAQWHSANAGSSRNSLLISFGLSRSYSCHESGKTGNVGN